MLEAEFFIFCRGAQINADGIDFMRTQDTIFTTKFPTVVAYPLTVVSKLRVKKALSGDAIPYKVEIERNGEVVFSNSNKMPGRRVPKDGVVYFQADLQRVILKEAGKYHVNLYMNDRKVITRPLFGILMSDKDKLGEQEIIQETH